jgi:hypothetical protein
MSKPTKIWFAWACHLSRVSVEPLYEAAKLAGYDCELSPRGRYDDLVERMKPFTHYVFGVGPDLSWKMAKEAGVIGINIQHGQYIFGTWRGPMPDHAILTGEAYRDDEALKTNPLAASMKIYTPGYIRAGVLRTYRGCVDKTIDCLVTLPKIDEHKSIETMQIIEAIGHKKNMLYRVHPRNSSVKAQLISMGLAVDETPQFYDSLAKAKCVLSGPSNCIIECCALGIPVGLFALPSVGTDTSKPAREQVMRDRYFKLMTTTYSPLAQIFNDVEQLLSWVAHPIVQSPEEAKRYWSNLDGSDTPIINCFLDIVNNS